MKLSLEGLSKVSASFPPPVPNYSFYEYNWDGPKRVHVPVWQPRQTTISVVFDSESRHFFSSARILLYHTNSGLSKVPPSNAWDIQQQGSVVHSLRGHVQNATPNDPSLPQLTVAFEVVMDRIVSNVYFGTLVLRSPESIQELRRSSISVLLEHELSLTCDSLSLSLSFTHSIMLCTPVTSGCLELTVPTHPASRIEYITTRIVRVFPPASSRPRITNGCLPTELLIKTFEDAEFHSSWHDDLLSFAQVCRAWLCAMDVLHTRMSFSDDDKCRQSRHLLDVYTLAMALEQKPLIGHSFRHFTTDNLGNPLNWREMFNLTPSHHPTRFTAALIAILHTTKNLQNLHLGQLDPCQTGALFTALCGLRYVRTFSIGQVEENLMGGLIKHERADGTNVTRMLSVVQLARCMARWPALKSLKVHHLHPGRVSGGARIWRFALRPPICALTQLTISRSCVSDKDLMRLFASSARTLERVVLDRIDGVTNAGLCAFLLAIAQNVVYLTVQDVALPPFRQWGNLVIGRMERALDVVVDKMPRLVELRIGGDVASEFMLDRRSKMFVAHNEVSSEKTQVPVVRLWMEDVPRLCGFAADGKWPGWYTPGKVPLR